jgi:hypothetical protein
MDDDVLLAREARQRALEIATLDWNWDGAYSFGWDRLTLEFTALRPDTGKMLRAHTAYELRRLVLEDYEARPVPRPPLRLVDD